MRFFALALLLGAILAGAIGAIIYILSSQGRI
jgi:hypothetical protein